MPDELSSSGRFHHAQAGVVGTLGFGYTNPVGAGRVLDVCLCFGCSGVGGEWVGGVGRGLGPGSGGVVLCLCEFELSV